MTLQSYVALAKNVIPKRLEGYYLLDKRSDDLFELNEEAFNFILLLDGTKRLSELPASRGFFNKLNRLNFLTFSDSPLKRDFFVSAPPLPSLRYLEIQLTERCNLNCLHCYQGEKGRAELPLKKLLSILEDFVKLQGLRVILSGGEPLLYSQFSELNSFLKDYPARVVLLTNGILLNDMDVKGLNVDEVQFSLDGMEHGHDYLRGKGSFKKLIKAVEKLKKETAIDISFATVVHRENLKEFKEMKRLVKQYGAKEWGIDYPLLYGNLGKHLELFVNADEALKAMKYRFGASFHDTAGYEEYACGLHLLTLTAKGTFLQCSFFPDDVLGGIEEGLFEIVKRRRFVTKEAIEECRECEFFSDCHGGCRYRAGGLEKRDMLMCKVFGKDKNL